MSSSYIDLLIATVLLLAGAAGSIIGNKLTLPAAAGAFCVGILVFTGSGYAGLIMLAAFFILATLATAHKKKWKAQLTEQSRHQQKRSLSQVLANGGVAALLGLLAMLWPAYRELLGLMLASAISSATADTLASELGMVYGRNAFNILSFKRDTRGLDGVISLEGTLLGMAGSVVIALIDAAAEGAGQRTLVIILAGTVGNLADSLLGATLERRRYLNNDMVNALNTLIAALAAWGCWQMMR